MRTLSLAAVLLLARIAAATTAADVPCASFSPPPGPCIVNTMVAVDNDSKLEFGTRQLRVVAGGRLDGGTGGAFEVDAASLIVQPGGKITAAGGDITIVTTGDIQVQAQQGAGAIDVSADYPGSMVLDSGGNVIIGGSLLATPNADQGGDGFIEVDALGNITLADSGRIAAPGGRFGFGGEVELVAQGDVTIAGVISVAGVFNGGVIGIQGSNVTTTSASDMNLRSGAGGQSASLDIAVDNDIVLGGPINGLAAGSADLGGGAGAEIGLDAPGQITINGQIIATGGGPDGVGGNIDAVGDGGIIQNGRIVAEATGNGYGGTVNFSAGAAPISVGQIDASGPVTGGSIFVSGYAAVTVTDTLSTDGPNAVITLEGCGVTVQSGTTVSSQGGGGGNTLRASGQLLVQGTVRAVGGQNRFEYRSAATPPSVTGTVTPAPILLEVPSLVPCGGPPTTTTTTSTTSSTVTTTTAITSPGSTTTSSTVTGSTGTTSTTATTTTTSPATTSTATTSTGTSSTALPTTTTSSTASTSTTTLPSNECVPVDCNDDDSCTLDTCDPVVGCTHEPVAELDSVTCRLEGMTDALAVASDTDAGGPRLHRRLGKRVAKAHGLVDAARGASARQQRARLVRANRLVGGVVRSVEKGKERGKVATALADLLLELGRGAQGRLQPLLAK